MKVGIFRNTDGACDFYRVVLPMQAAERYHKLTTSDLWSANLLYEVGTHSEKFAEVMKSDIYLVQRISTHTLMHKLREFVTELKLKTKIIMDHDDDIFNVSPLSNHYVDYGTEEAKIFHNGKIIHEWKDGLTIDIGTNRKRIDGVKKAFEKIDLLTVTTDQLAESFRPYAPNIKVLPNCVDLFHWNRLPLIREKKDEIRICWAGGHSHFEDLQMIRDPLIEISKKYPNVKILMLGYMPMSMQQTFRPGQVEFHRWVEFAAHPYRLAALDIDIAMIPLRNTVFNNGKSAIKWVEFSALQIPSITSYITPYKEVADLENSENGIYIGENDPNAWFQGMELLINDAQMRKTLGERARKTVEDHFDINKKYPLWVDAYEELINADNRQPAHC